MDEDISVGYVLILKVSDRENSSRIFVGDTFASSCITGKRVAVTCPGREGVEEVVIYMAYSVRFPMYEDEEMHTPRSPCGEACRAQHSAELVLKINVLLKMVIPRRNRLIGIANIVSLVARIIGGDGVNLGSV